MSAGKRKTLPSKYAGMEFTYYLKQAINNPLDTDYYFYLDGEIYLSDAEPSFVFMEFVCSFEPGTTLYIGEASITIADSPD